MNYHTSVTDTLDDRMLDNRNSMDSPGQEPELPSAQRRPKTSGPARATAGPDGIRAFMKDFTASAVKPDASNGQMNVAPATGIFSRWHHFLFENDRAGSPCIPLVHSTLTGEKTMTHRVSGTAGLRLVPYPMNHGFLATAIRPWQLLARKMAERKTRLSLFALDDHLLKDIGISRSIIDCVARTPAGGHSFTDRAGQSTCTTPQSN